MVKSLVKFVFHIKWYFYEIINGGMLMLRNLNFMKKNKLVALMFVMSSVVTVSAQKIEDVVLKYEYIQQPLNPLEGLESYNFTVQTPYPENNDALMAQAELEFQERLAAYPAEVEEAKRIHGERVVNYDDEVALAQENFKLETEGFDKLSGLEKLALEEGRPKLRMPSKPGPFRAPNEPYYIEPNTSTSIVFKPSVLADTYLKVDGFEKGTTNALTGSVVMEAFDAGQPERKESTNRVYNATTKKYVDQKTYSFDTAVRRPTRLALEFNGQSIYNDIFEGTGEYSTISTPTSPNMFQLEKDNVSDILNSIREFINLHYGFVRVPSTLTVRSPKNKGDFDDLENAAKLGKRGINPMGSSDGVAELTEAINIWETVLGESDVNDKKARINGKVTESIYQNLIEAAIFKEDFVRAQDFLVLFGEMDLKKSEVSWVNSRTAFIEKRLGN